MKSTITLIWNALLTAVVATLLAGLFVAAMPPVYLATATVKGGADGILIIRSGDLIEEVTRIVKPRPDDLRGWLQELTTEAADVQTMLKQHLTVQVRPDDGWLDITVQARVSTTAAALANEIARAYLSRIDQNKLTPEAKARLFEPVEAAEAELAAYLAANPALVKFPAALQVIDRKIQDLSRKIEVADKTLADVKRQRDAAANDVSQLTDASVVRALQRLATVKQRLAEMSTRYGNQHQKMIGVQAELIETHRQLDDALGDFKVRLDQRELDIRRDRDSFAVEGQRAADERESLLAREARHQTLKLARESALARFNGITEERKRYEFSEAVPPPNSLGFAQLVALIGIFALTFVMVLVVSVLRRRAQ